MIREHSCVAKQVALSPDGSLACYRTGRWVTVRSTDDFSVQDSWEVPPEAHRDMAFNHQSDMVVVDAPHRGCVTVRSLLSREFLSLGMMRSYIDTWSVGKDSPTLALPQSGYTLIGMDGKPFAFLGLAQRLCALHPACSEFAIGGRGTMRRAKKGGWCDVHALRDKQVNALHYSPCGSWLYTVTSENDIYRVSVKYNKTELVTSLSPKYTCVALNVSPNGEQLALALNHRKGEKNEIYVIPTDPGSLAEGGEMHTLPGDKPYLGMRTTNKGVTVATARDGERRVVYVIS